MNNALTEMNKDPRGNVVDGDSNQPSKNGVAPSKIARSKQGKITSKVKGEKKATVTIAALKGKGYPAPVEINTGEPAK